MEADAVVPKQATLVRRSSGTTGSVTSRDGTTIGYRLLGQGPGIVVMHGAMEAGRSHLQLAEMLADAYTVYLPDRRGRGLSGPYADAYRVQDDVDDLDALLTRTGAHDVFGVSSGAIICLQAALSLPAIRRVAAFEPPLLVNGSSSAIPALARFDHEIAQGKVAAALVTAMQAAEMGPQFLNAVPRWLLTPFELLVNLGMANEAKRATGDSVSMRALAPTLHYDFQLILDSVGALDTFRTIQSRVLLLGGSKSPASLKAALDALQKVLPQATRIEFAGLDHRAAGNTDDPMTGRGSQPAQVAQELRRFFA
jgi:pimeloyl-ACP methyl ester carboxylesterase